VDGSHAAGLAPPVRLTEDRFSIFWVTDTQFLSESNPDLFVRAMSWIADNFARYNGKMVIHTGDIVQTGSVQAEWSNADGALSVLLGRGIPYTWCAGNHDDLSGDDPSSGWMGRLWARSLDPSVVGPMVDGAGSSHWVGDLRDGMNTAVSFSAGRLKFLVLNLEWGADASTLEWAQETLDDPAYADHRVIAAAHAYIDPSGSTEGPDAEPVLLDFTRRLTALLNRHSPRVFLTLNGHFPTDQGYNTPQPVNGRNELMFDRQDCTDDPRSPQGRGVDGADATVPSSRRVGGATVTVLTFDPGQNVIEVSTYDAHTGAWRDDPNERYVTPMFPPGGSRSSVTGSLVGGSPLTDPIPVGPRPGPGIPTSA
jgi:hypothetical protein